MSKQASFLAAIMAAALLSLSFGACVVRADQWDPPANYYSAASATDGPTLKGQFLTRMTPGPTDPSRTYGDLRFSAAVEDTDPGNANNIILLYNGASVPATWDPNNQTSLWNREHVWPVSLQGGNDPSNSTTGHRADPHAVMPANPTINSNRGNQPFGFEANTGGHMDIGTYYYPGNNWRGNVARSLFYSETRYGPSLGLTLVDDVPGSFEMGDLSSLIAWHYLDAPDDFERARNHKIYSQALNPDYYTNIRNAYIDRPESVWAIYKGNNNDSQITIVGGTAGGNGATTRNVDLGRVFTGAGVPTAPSFTLSKAGDAGTYFEVTTAGQASSALSGRHNAFCITSSCAGFTGQLTTTTKAITVGIAPTLPDNVTPMTSTAGLKSGTVTIDNLDITNGGGAGRGSDDGDDVFNVSLTVLDHAQPSFQSGSTQLTKTLNFGNVPVGSVTTLSFDVFNRLATAGFTANMDFDSITPSGHTAQLTTNAGSLAGSLVLAGGTGQSLAAMLNTSVTGTFSAAYTFNFSDENIAGAQSKSITLNLTGTVRLPGDYNGDGQVDTLDFVVWRANFGSNTSAYGSADGNGDTVINDADFGIWTANFGASAPMAGGGSSQGSSAVPEPGAAALVWIVGACATRRRGQRSIH